MRSKIAVINEGCGFDFRPYKIDSVEESCGENNHTTHPTTPVLTRKKTATHPRRPLLRLAPLDMLRSTPPPISYKRGYSAALTAIQAVAPSLLGCVAVPLMLFFVFRLWRVICVRRQYFYGFKISSVLLGSENLLNFSLAAVEVVPYCPVCYKL